MNPSSKMLSTLLMVAVLSSSLCISTCSAFVTPGDGSYRSKTMSAFYYQNTAAPSELSMASSIMQSPRQSFEDRMRGMVLGGRKKKQATKEKQQLPQNIKVVRNLDEYKTVVGGERERIVVVRFFAPWCKACKAIRPLFYRLAHENANVLFVEVPVTEANANLHQGLGIPSLPFGHIYAPNGGLVEELKITRPHFGKFAQKLQTYVQGQCDMESDDVSSPYETPSKPKELPATSRNAS